MKKSNKRMSNKSKWILSGIIAFPLTFWVSYELWPINLLLILVFYGLFCIVARLIIQIPAALIIDNKNKIIAETSRKKMLESMPPPPPVKCAKCGSTQLVAHQGGFGIGRAIVGSMLVSDLFGLIWGASKSNKIYITCLNCGNQWEAKKQ